MSKIDFGNRQASILCNMTRLDQLELLAEGLPIIWASAEGFWNASTQLPAQPREAGVLEGFAEEEAAKALILMDLVRCPKRQVARRVGRIVKTFYDHLGRLIYAEAQGWRPANFAQLRDYVDNARLSHDLEGYAGEHIMPNWSRYARESAMYADIERHEDGNVHWNDPRHYCSIAPSLRPLALNIIEALHAVGIFDRRGLKIVSEVWDSVDFHEAEDFDRSRDLTRALFIRLDEARLITDAATKDHFRCITNYWQMPMYHLDFRELTVPLEDLKARQEANLWAEAGYHVAYG